MKDLPCTSFDLDSGPNLRDICKNKHGGNSESQMAFKRVRRSNPKGRTMALAYIAGCENGATCQEYADYLGVPINKISGRFSELKKAGLIEKIGVRNGGGVFVVKGK